MSTRIVRAPVSPTSQTSGDAPESSPKAGGAASASSSPVDLTQKGSFEAHSGRDLLLNDSSQTTQKEPASGRRRTSTGSDDVSRGKRALALLSGGDELLPDTKGKAEAKGESAGKGKAEAKGKAEGKGETTGKSEAEGKGKAETKGKAASKGKAEAKGRAESKSGASGEARAKGKGRGKKAGASESAGKATTSSGGKTSGKSATATTGGKASGKASTGAGASGAATQGTGPSGAQGMAGAASGSVDTSARALQPQATGGTGAGSASGGAAAGGAAATGGAGAMASTGGAAGAAAGGAASGADGAAGLTSSALGAGAAGEGKAALAGKGVVAGKGAAATGKSSLAQGAAGAAAQGGGQAAGSAEGSRRSLSLSSLLMREVQVGESAKASSREDDVSPRQEFRQLVRQWASAQEATMLHNLTHTAMPNDVAALAWKIATLAQQGALPQGELMSLIAKTLKKPGNRKKIKRIKDLLVKKGFAAAGMSDDTLELIAAMVALYLAKQGNVDADDLIEELFGMPSRGLGMFLPEGGGSHHQEGREEHAHQEHRDGERLAWSKDDRGG